MCFKCFCVWFFVIGCVMLYDMFSVFVFVCLFVLVSIGLCVFDVDDLCGVAWCVCLCLCVSLV